MTPEGSLTEWQKLEVERLITLGIEKYDVVNSERHAENTKKLDRLTYLLLGTLLTAGASLVLMLVTHGMGK